MPSKRSLFVLLLIGAVLGQVFETEAKPTLRKKRNTYNVGDDIQDAYQSISEVDNNSIDDRDARQADEFDDSIDDRDARQADEFDDSNQPADDFDDTNEPDRDSRQANTYTPPPFPGNDNDDYDYNKWTEAPEVETTPRTFQIPTTPATYEITEKTAEEEPIHKKVLPWFKRQWGKTRSFFDKHIG